MLRLLVIFCALCASARLCYAEESFAIDEQLLTNLERRTTHSDGIRLAADDTEIQRLRLQVALLEKQIGALTDRVALLEGRIAKTHPNKAGERVTAALASHKDRSSSLEQVVASITGQVHQLFVYLEGYDSVPSMLDKPWIQTFLQPTGATTLGNAGKWIFRQTGEGYHFLLGDQLIYPRDYVSLMTKKIEVFKRRAIVGVEGHTFLNPFSSYSASRNTTSATQVLAEDVPVHVLGAETMAYHTSIIDLPEHSELFRHQEHCTIDHLVVSLFAQNKGIPLYAVARPSGWISEIPGQEGKNQKSIEDRNRLATSLIRSSIDSWRRRHLAIHQ